MRIRGLIAACAALVPASAGAEEYPAWLAALYPQASVVSDYRFHGISNNNREPTVQTSLFAVLPANFYAGIWTTSVDFQDNTGTSYEVDIYGGRYFYLGQTRIGIEGMATLFPDQEGPGPTYDFYQGIVKATHTEGPVTLNGRVSWSPEAAAGAGEAWIFSGETQYAVADDVSLVAKLGGRTVERRVNHRYWELGAIMRVKDIEFDVRYIDTDLERSQCFFTDWCEPAVVAKITYNIPVGGWRNLSR